MENTIFLKQVSLKKAPQHSTPSPVQLFKKNTGLPFRLFEDRTSSAGRDRALFSLKRPGITLAPGAVTFLFHNIGTKIMERKTDFIGFLIVLALCFEIGAPRTIPSNADRSQNPSKEMAHSLFELSRSDLTVVLPFVIDDLGINLSFKNAAVQFLSSEEQETEGVHYEKGLAFLKSKNLEKAKEEFLKEESLFPGKVPVFLKLIEIQLLQGMAPEPLILKLFRLLKNNPGEEDIGVYLSLVHELMGRPEKTQSLPEGETVLFEKRSKRVRQIQFHNDFQKPKTLLGDKESQMLFGFSFREKGELTFLQPV